MATGFNIILPNGSVERTTTSTFEQRLSICNALLERWSKYCYDNWLSANANHPFSPQNKVKMFLSNLGYFLLTGSGGDDNRIVTRYKEVMNGKRQVPVSQCPEYVEDKMYGLIHTGGVGTLFARDQKAAFEEYMSAVDERVEQKYKRKPKRNKTIRTSVSDRYTAAKKNCSRPIERAVVNTDGQFQFDGKTYQIDMEHVKQYAPKQISEDEVLYDMDCVMCARNLDGTIQIYDQDYYPIDPQFIG